MVNFNNSPPGGPPIPQSPEPITDPRNQGPPEEDDEEKLMRELEATTSNIEHTQEEVSSVDQLSDQVKEQAIQVNAHSTQVDAQSIQVDEKSAQVEQKQVAEAEKFRDTHKEKAAVDTQKVVVDTAKVTEEVTKQVKTQDLTTTQVKKAEVRAEKGSLSRLFPGAALNIPRTEKSEAVGDPFMHNGRLAILLAKNGSSADPTKEAFVRPLKREDGVNAAVGIAYLDNNEVEAFEGTELAKACEKKGKVTLTDLKGNPHELVPGKTINRDDAQKICSSYSSNLSTIIKREEDKKNAREPQVQNPDAARLAAKNGKSRQEEIPIPKWNRKPTSDGKKSTRTLFGLANRMMRASSRSSKIRAEASKRDAVTREKYIEGQEKIETNNMESQRKANVIGDALSRVEKNVVLKKKDIHVINGSEHSVGNKTITVSTIISDFSKQFFKSIKSLSSEESPHNDEGRAAA